MVQGEDGMERESAIFQSIVQCSFFQRMPSIVNGDDHVDGAATKVLPLCQDMRRVLPDDQSSDVGETKDFVERKCDKVRRSSRIGQIQGSGTCKRSRV